MNKLSKHDKTRLIDLLNERLAFERNGVKLYDAILGKLGAAADGQAIAATLKEHRNQEKEHEEWLEEQIRKLGGTAKDETDKSRLVKRESRGIEDVINGDTELPHLMHALLVAELVDNEGWAMLIELADAAKDQEALKAFEQRKNHEEEHLTFAREVMLAFGKREILGESAQLPSSTP